MTGGGAYAWFQTATSTDTLGKGASLAYPVNRLQPPVTDSLIVYAKDISLNPADAGAPLPAVSNDRYVMGDKQKFIIFTSIKNFTLDQVTVRVVFYSAFDKDHTGTLHVEGPGVSFSKVVTVANPKSAQKATGDGVVNLEVKIPINSTCKIYFTNDP